MINKKSQMEILGLAIVIVLLLVALAFVIRFMAFEKSPGYRKSFMYAQIATNMLDAFLSTASSGCSQLTMTELLQDCAQAKSIQCDNGQYSCEYAESTANEIFDKTMGKWNMNYEFLVFTDVNSLIHSGKACTGDIRPGLFHIPINSGTVHIRLNICSS